MMKFAEQSPVQTTDNNGWFTTTHWTLVLQAGDAESAQAQAALAKLCQAYWYPLYVFIRRQGRGLEDAQDLVQGFFARVLEKNYLKDADRTKGRFRSFLLLALKRYMANEWDYDHCEKRGGGKKLISLDEQDTEMRYLAEPADEMSPEKAYERRWALTLLQRVLDRLSSEFSTSSKVKVFDELKVFLNGENGGSYAEIGLRLGLSESAIKVTVHRLRKRYREILRLEIANTVSSPEAAEDELRNLFAALS